MVAAEHINHIIPYLSPNDSVQKAIHWMEEYKVSHLPVINNNKYLGILAENTILDIGDLSTKIEDIQLSLVNIHLLEDNHVYDAIHLLDKYQIGILPILNRNLEYLGLITIADIIETLANITSFKNIGAIIILKVADYNYSLHEISRIVETNGIKVLSSHIEESNEPNFLEVTLKLNTKAIDAVVSSFERYSYNIVATFHRDISNDSDEDKLNHFFKFLNI